MNLHEVEPKYLEPGHSLEAGIHELEDVVVTFIGDITCSKIALGTTYQGRMLTGENPQGKEAVDSQWLEVNNGSGWIPIGGGPDGDTVELTETTTVGCRLNIPSGAATTGDWVANLELFYYVE